MSEPLPPQGAQGKPEENPEEFLTRDEEFRLTKLWQEQGDLSARARIVAAYSKLAHAFAARAARSGLPMEDLVQEANIGLIQALDKFEPERKYGFGTFARYHIISRIQIYMLENVAPLRIFNTAATKALLSRYSRMKKDIEVETGGPLDESGRELIAQRLGIDVEQVRRYELATAFPAALDPGAGVAADDTSRPIELQDEDPDPESQVLNKLAREHVRGSVMAALESLDARESEIFAARHLSTPPETLDALSQRYGISRERVRQIEMSARTHVRRALQREGISGSSSLFTSG
jgi:RNA polymerase sigma-32 factor